ncbi:MAG: GNAT family N-acetyltransferase [Thermoplasmata archaeon]|nr:MAG: GNAT family N-acetyltransferase [Thermoplasmata archaeon]
MNIEIVEKLNDSQIKNLYELFSNERWTKHRKPNDIRKMIEKSDMIIGIVEKDTGKLLAFSRILTDFIYRAMIYDVMVNQSYRKKGLGRTLMKSIVNHPLLMSIEYIEIQCEPEMISFYEQFGFDKDIVGSMHTLRIVHNKE